MRIFFLFLIIFLGFGEVKANHSKYDNLIEEVRWIYPDAVCFSPSLTMDEGYVFLRSRDLKDNLEALNDFFKLHPNVWLILDLCAADDDRSNFKYFCLKSELLPSTLKKLVVVNLDQDIRQFDFSEPCFLTHIAFAFFSNLNFIKPRFLSKFQNLESIVFEENTFKHVIDVGFDSFYDFPALKEVKGLEHVSGEIQRRICQSLLYSSVLSQKDLGFRFYVHYFCPKKHKLHDVSIFWNIGFLHRFVCGSPREKSFDQIEAWVHCFKLSQYESFLQGVVQELKKYVSSKNVGLHICILRRSMLIVFKKFLGYPHTIRKRGNEKSMTYLEEFNLLEAFFHSFFTLENFSRFLNEKIQYKMQVDPDFVKKLRQEMGQDCTEDKPFSAEDIKALLEHIGLLKKQAIFENG